ncbi:MAG: CDP-alcohol phosphatidyltransferase family protein [Gemmatimonadetes bacterium]|nr:CDP-alcohol phosphatidyltransferase family protein [Gemmatimonadota bacterium]
MKFSVVLFADTDATAAGAARPVYGIPLLERHLRVFASLGARRVSVVGPAPGRGSSVRIDGFDGRWFRELGAVDCVRTDESPARWLPGKDETALVLDAHHLYDPRVLRDLIDGGSNRRAVDQAVRASCRLLVADADLLTELAASWTGSESLWSALDTAPESACSVYDLRDMDPYIVDLRRSLPPFWLVLDSDRKVQQAEMLLIDAAQKGTLDFPAEFIHPPLENVLTKWVSAGPVTPNQVTTLTIVLAFLTTGLLAAGQLASGYLIAGLVIAFIVGVLDGVDGKLARVTVRCTRFGDRYEHILDVVWELTWYWALGWMLSGGGALVGPFVLSTVITLFYLLDKTATGMFKSRQGIELFDCEPVDRFFRRIGARRNTNVLLLLGGTAAGMLEEAFTFVAIWTVITAAFHWTRAIWLMSKPAAADEENRSV